MVVRIFFSLHSRVPEPLIRFPKKNSSTKSTSAATSQNYQASQMLADRLISIFSKSGQCNCGRSHVIMSTHYFTHHVVFVLTSL